MVFNTLGMLWIVDLERLVQRVPNKRHPTRKYIGFWATTFLKQKLTILAVRKKMSLSELILGVLWKYIESQRRH